MNKGKLHLYGKFYDSSKETLPNESSSYDVIIYSDSSKVTRAIGSLEGHFVSTSVLEDNHAIPREKMDEFEERFNGRFVPFGEDVISALTKLKSKK